MGLLLFSTGKSMCWMGRQDAWVPAWQRSGQGWSQALGSGRLGFAPQFAEQCSLDGMNQTPGLF